MILTLYSLLMRAVQPLMLRKLRRRAQAEPLYGVAPHERLGLYAEAPPFADTSPTASDALVVWVHAVSLGETMACAALVAQLRVLRPGMRLLLTHSTATGREQGIQLLQDGDRQAWLPWDTPQAVARFLRHFRPTIGLLVETEIWPHLVAQCRAHAVPLCLVNARLSEKSMKRAQRLAWLARPAYRGLSAVWAQSADDAGRLVTLGAPVQGVMGNFKFDVQPDANKLQQGQQWRSRQSGRGKPVIVFASSREGEESEFLAFLEQNMPLAVISIAYDAINNIANAVQWMIVPRHPQRFDAVARMCADRGWTVLRRSQWGSDGPADGPVTRTLWLGDTLGDMALYYGLSDVALLGGSFAPLGGQNLIEAAACGCPVVMGPHTFNFAEAARLAVAAGAAWQVADMAAGVQQALQLVQTPAAQQAASQAGIHLAHSHQGAARHTAQAVVALLPAPA
jgi:3-deoxy-D-manno-octulosonic-acid transferase